MSAKEIETKDSPRRFEFKADDEKGEVSGFLSTFGNIDLIDDIVEAGAFKRTLNSMKKAGRGLKMLVLHSTHERAGLFPVGGKEGLKETDEGLFSPGAPLNLETQTGREAFSDAKFGLLDSFSIGFIPERVEFVSKSVGGEKRMIRRILEARLMETSLVVFPANPKAAVTGTKSRWDVCDCETKNDLHEEACPRFMGKTDRILITMQSDLASLLQGPEAKKTDSDSIFADIEANLAKINTQLKGA